MNVAKARFFSESLKQHVSYNVILPESGSGPFPVLQLHGYTDDRFAWLLQSNLVRHARPYPSITVLPNGGTSFYLNLKSAGRFGVRRYGDFMIKHLHERVAERDKPPVLTFDCGVDDELIDENRKLHARMEQAGLVHTHKEHPGAHTCAYRPATLPALVVLGASEVEARAAKKQVSQQYSDVRSNA